MPEKVEFPEEARFISQLVQVAREVELAMATHVNWIKEPEEGQIESERSSCF